MTGYLLASVVFGFGCHLHQLTYAFMLNLDMLAYVFAFLG